VLSAELLVLGGLASNQAQALQQVDSALDSGAALDHFARMVAALGGPTDFVERCSHYLPSAPVQMEILAPHSGWVAGMATRDIGLLIIELGGGRRQAGHGRPQRDDFGGVFVHQHDVLVRMGFLLAAVVLLLLCGIGWALATALGAVNGHIGGALERQGTGGNPARIAFGRHTEHGEGVLQDGQQVMNPVVGLCFIMDPENWTTE
jgi:hypothetical protein